MVFWNRVTYSISLSLFIFHRLALGKLRHVSTSACVVLNLMPLILRGKEVKKKERECEKDGDRKTSKWNHWISNTRIIKAVSSDVSLFLTEKLMFITFVIQNQYVNSFKRFVFCISLYIQMILASAFIYVNVFKAHIDKKINCMTFFSS